MAESIYFPDGTSTVLVHDKNDPTGLYAFLEIIENRLGRDAADFAREIINPAELEADVQAMEQELDGYESTLESYRDCLLSVQDALQELRGRMAIKDRKATRENIIQILNTQIGKIHNEL